MFKSGAEFIFSGPKKKKKNRNAKGWRKRNWMKWALGLHLLHVLNIFGMRRDGMR
jgi:hypothetical protein